MTRARRRRAQLGLALPFVASCTAGTANYSPAPPATAFVPPPPVELRLERALAIDITGDYQPSGLAFRDDKLLTVSDKDDTAIHEIIQGEASATLRTLVTFTAPGDDSSELDLEGIAVDADRALLLASEARYRVLRVDLGGGASWLTPSVEEVGRRAGLFQRHNANLEGIARLPDGRLLLAAEREQRGLVELPANGDLSGAKAWAMPGSIYPLPAGRGTDFADLAVADGQTYALERNSHLVVRIERTDDRWVEREAWSYARTENDPRFAYEDTRYGIVEGLAIDRNHVYLVTDNNRLARAADPLDHRPQLFVFARPGR